MDRERLLGNFLAPDHRAADFPFRPGAALALFERQQTHEVLGMLLNDIANLRNHRLALLDRAGGPFGKGAPRR